MVRARELPGRARVNVLSMVQAAAALHKSRRWLQNWLREHPADQNGRPFYSPLGRTKTFDEEDLKRIRAVAREEEARRLEQAPCPSSSSPPQRTAARRSTRSAARTEASIVTEALKL